MSSTLRMQINVPGICDPVCLKKLKALLSQYFNVEADDNIAEHMSFKARINRTGLPKDIHIEIFVNENVEFKASPEVKDLFQKVCSEIKSILTEAVNLLSRQDTVRVNRARRIMEYMRTVSVENEIERMVVVTLCDIVLDLLVTEKLSHFAHKRQDLDNESVGAKLGMLQNQYKIPIYRPKAIRDIRELRNRVAHGGTSPVTDEATFAQDATTEIFELF